MASRRAVVLRRSAPVAAIALVAAGVWAASGSSSPSGTIPSACAATPCVVETAERIEAPPVERARRPATPTLDWRSLLPAGFLRPR